MARASGGYGVQNDLISCWRRSVVGDWSVTKRVYSDTAGGFKILIGLKWRIVSDSEGVVLG